MAAQKKLLGDLDARTASRLIESSSDLALVLDGEGTILDVVTHDAELADRGAAAWRGRHWSDTVTLESREKVAQMLAEAEAAVATRRRQVNHPTASGEDLPILYSAVRVDADKRMPAQRRYVAFGRDLRPTVALQRRLVEAQQAMERDYWRFREAETRYRNLFQTAPEAVLVVDGQSQKVVEANPAAEAQFSGIVPRLVGAALTSLFDDGAAEALQSLLAAARTVGRREPLRLRLADGRTEVAASASLFRQDQAPFLLMRLLPVAAPLTDAQRGRAAATALRPLAGTDDALLQSFLRNAPDAVVFTDHQGRVTHVNRAFAAMAQLSAEDQARGEMLDRWIGSTGVELGVLIGNLRQRGSVGLFRTTLRGEFGATLEVELSASTLDVPGAGAAQRPALAFAVRDVGRRLQGGPDEARVPAAKVSRSVGELTELVGRVPMKEIVSETTDLIERLCIETALQMTNDNRALAAQLLGLSRQSLYVKLRRFGLGDLGAGGDAGD
jgi:transcriptional regulator PpsR